MARCLVERGGFTNTPPLLATIELDMAGETGARSSALGALFAYVRNQGDGWNQALDYLGRYLDDAQIGHAAVRGWAGQVSDLADPDHFFLMLARQLGIRTAQMHRALAENAGDDPDFRPEPIGREDLAAWRGELENAADDMLSALRHYRPSLSGRTGDLADQLLAAPDGLLPLIHALTPAEIVAQKTRCHGDFHLGQVMVVQNDFFITGFEGSPALPLNARRRKSSPLRDVAAMMRSFDYAAGAALRQLAESRPAAEPRMVALGDAWRQRAVDGFRAAYRKSMRGCASYPESKKQVREMTAFFTLERAVHELSYELANRPAWVEIPLQGILAILAKARASPSAASGEIVSDSPPPAGR